MKSSYDTTERSSEASEMKLHHMMQPQYFFEAIEMC